MSELRVGIDARGTESGQTETFGMGNDSLLQIYGMR